MITTIIAITVFIAIVHYRKRKENVRAPEPIYDDPDGPHFTTRDDVKQVPSKPTEISLQEQPDTKENVAYGAFKQPQGSAESEEQC